MLEPGEAKWDCLNPAVSSAGFVGVVLKERPPGHLSQVTEFAALVRGLTTAELLMVLDFCNGFSLSISSGLIICRGSIAFAEITPSRG